ncbi:NHLP bacteriocin export ABC transporter permease/ATPase subunit, partial [Azospirillum doebereinerae]|uniref:NHLP bacteriocin export ABC transporter permease/ATPase subunit n=2 Tax=Azospirillum doebereinerae TaxID=92933 RepID=UPI001EE5CD0B
RQPHAVQRHADPRRPLWLRVEEGAAAWLDGPMVAAGDPPLPLADRAWIAAAETGDADLSLTEAWPDDAELWPALDAFHGLVLDRIAARVAGQADHEARRVRDSRRSSRDALARALGGMTGLVEGASPDAPPALDFADPLTAALSAVMARLGVEESLPRPDASAAAGTGNAAERLTASLAAVRLRTRKVLLRDGWWGLDGAAMLGWLGEERQPVALLPDAGGFVMLSAAGRVRVTADLAVRLAPEALHVYRPLPARALSAMEALRFPLRGLSADGLRLALCGLGGALLALLVPVATGLLFDDAIPRADHGALAFLVAGLVAAAIGGAAFDLVKTLAVLRLESRIDGVMQAAVMDRLLALPVGFFRRFTAGDLADRTLGLQSVREILAASTMAGLLGALFGLVSLGLLVVYDGRLALLAAGLALLSALVTAGLSYGQLRHEREQVRRQGRLDGLVLQLIVGIGKLRVAGAEPRAMAQWARGFTAQKARAVAAQRYANALESFHAVFPALATAAVFLAVALLMESDAREQALQALAATPGAAPGALGGAETPTPFTTGRFLAFTAAFGQLLAALTEMANAVTKSLSVLPLLERARPILATAPEVPAGRDAPGALAGGVSLSRVAFRYAPDAPRVLHDLSLSIEPGAFVAVVGPSGSGKSTVLRLLLGFERPDQGEVFFDGRAAERLDMAAVRRQIGVVLQNGRITAGSLFQNIVGTAPLGLDDAWHAARLVGLDQDIEQMPMGMHTVLMDGGGTLSGGQRQRLMIARALVHRPRILLLDEATSALDNRTQAVVTASLGKLSVTRVVIAHRLSTIRDVDRVFVLEGGRLVQSGRYEDLMAVDGPFKTLANRQLL